MSTMTIERRKKIENHIVKTYFTKHFGIEHGSNGWDIIHGSSDRADRDVPTVLAESTWDEGRVVVHWFIPGEVSYIDPACTIAAAYYELVVVPGWFDTSDNKLELDKANDKIEELDRCLNQANDIIDEWKSNTCCDTPTEARKHIEELMEENASLQASVHNLEFTKAIGKEFGLKGCSTRRAFWIRRNTDRYLKLVNRPLNHILFGDGSTTYGRSLEGIQEYLDKNEYSCVMDAIDQLEVETDALKEDIGEWVKATRCLNPDEAKIKFNKGNDASVALVKERSYILELQKEIAAWQDATSCKVPKEAESRIINLLNDHGIDTLRIDSLKKRIAGWERSADYWGNKFAEWKKATECDTPEEAKKRIDGILDDLERDDDRICDLGIEIKKLQDRLKANKYNKLWITSNGMLFSESDITVDVLEAQVDRLNNEINDHVSHINELDARIKELSNVISEWQNATGCKLPSMAKEKIEHYERRLGNAVQAASCAAKHLDNITF